MKYLCTYLILSKIGYFSRALPCPFGCSWPLAQIPFRSLKRILDHSRVRFTTNPKLALVTLVQRIALADKEVPLEVGKLLSFYH